MRATTTQFFLWNKVDAFNVLLCERASERATNVLDTMLNNNPISVHAIIHSSLPRISLLPKNDCDVRTEL